jgi:HlyD family secretion protein
MMDRPIKKKFWNLRRIIWSVGIVVIVFLALYVLLSASGGSTLRVEAEKMTISTVKFDKFQEFIFENGIVTPIKTIYLDAEEGGRIEEILVEEGSFVHKGDSILRLDNTDLHLDIMYREAQLFEHINNLRNTRLAIEQQSLSIRGQLLEVDYQIQITKREFGQCETMHEKNLISKDEFDQARDNYDFWVKKHELTIETQRQDSILRAIQVRQLESSVERMQENLKVVKKKLENLVLTAPITGQLTSLNAEVGESKHRGERLGQIDVLDGFKLRAEVDEYYISRISINQKGSVEITGTSYDLNITKVYPEVKNGRFQIDLEFVGGEPDDIRRGQTVKINLALGDLSDAILIARGGFYQKTGGRWAFVLDESGNFATRRNIEIGRQNPRVYEVLSGLEPGEKVITSSYDNIEHFDRIVFKN